MMNINSFEITSTKLVKETRDILMPDLDQT